MSSNTVVIANSQEEKIRNAFASYFQNFFTDNKRVIESYASLSIDNSSNFFDILTSKILLSTMFNNGIFVGSNGQDSVDYGRYNNLFYCIFETSYVLYDIVSKTNNYVDIYGMLNKIVIHGRNIPIPNEVMSVAQTVSDGSMGAALATQYILNGTTLTIYCKSSDVSANITKPANMKVVVDNTDLSVDNNIILRYITFLMCFNKYNAKIQIYAFYYFMVLLNEYKKFRYFSEKLFYNSNQSGTESYCEYFASFSANLMQLNETLKNSVIQSGNTNAPNAAFTVKCIDLCPLVFDMQDNKMVIDMYSQLDDNYVFIMNGTVYDIISASYTENENKTGKEVKTITISATSTLSKSCNITASMPVLDIPINQLMPIMIREKNVLDLRKEYMTTGKDLREMNISIDKSKNKINSLSSLSKKQTERINSVNIRMYVYIAIILIILFLYVATSVVKNDRMFKLNIGIIAFLVLVIMNMFNYMLKFDYIETFVDASDVKNCSELGNGSAISDRINFIQHNVGILTTYTLDILLSYHLQLSTLDSEDLFKSISNSIQNEKNTFTEHRDVYKSRVEVNKASIDLEKHELNEKVQFLYLISTVFLIISILFILNAYDNKYVLIYLVAASLLIFIVFYQYYYAILHPTRSRARNKYWRKPSYRG
jgi:hypothetical protein